MYISKLQNILQNFSSRKVVLSIKKKSGSVVLDVGNSLVFSVHGLLIVMKG